MKQLTNSRLFCTLTNSSKENVCLTKLESAYEEFTMRLRKKHQTKVSPSELYYNLVIIHLELVGMRKDVYDEQGEKNTKYY